MFAGLPAGGNPTVVARLSTWPSDDVLLALASALPAEEVTFLYRDDGGEIRIRWFGPRGELPNCGHGALAATAVMQCGLRGMPSKATVGPKSVPLALDHSKGLPTIGMAPAMLHERASASVEIGLPVIRLFDAGRDYLAVVRDEQTLRAYRPDWDGLMRIGKIGLILSAPGATGVATFRFFAPRAGIPEDTASASVIPALVKYWFGEAQTHGTFVQCSGQDVRITARVAGDEVRVSGKVLELTRGRFDIALSTSTDISVHSF